MSASANDKFMKAGAGTVTTLSAPGKALSATSITVGSTTNYPTDTGIVFAIRQVDVNGELVAGTYTEWAGTVTSGTTLSMDAAPVYGSDQVYPAGSTTQVYIPLSSSAHNKMVDGLLVSHDQDGTLKAGAVDNAAVLASNVVETAKIKDGAVTPPKVDSPVQYSRKSYANGSGDYTTSSTTLVSVDATNLITSLTVKSGKLIRVDATIAGITNNNSGYSVGIDIGMDGVSTTSSSGVATIAPSNWANNWDTAGNSRATESHIFYFTNVSPGSHTFRLLWSSSNSGVTARITQYAQQKIIVTELA